MCKFMPVRILKFLFFSWLFATLIASCKPTYTDDELNIFRYNESAGISTLDPAFARDLPHIWACNQLYNGLVNLDEALQVVPAIAKNWEISNQGLTYTFHLRDDVYFHEDQCFEHGSRKVTASDFVYSFNRLLRPSLSSPGTWIFNQVKQYDGKHAFEAINDTTLQIELSSPFPAFLGVLAMVYASVVPHEALSHYGTDFRNNPVGTGPFQFQWWKEGVKLVFRKNPHYFEFENGQRLPHLDAVSISFLIDRQTAFLEFIKENLDFMSGIDSRYKDEILTRHGSLRKKYQDRIYLSRQPYLNTEYLGIFVDNMEQDNPDNPLSYRNIRRAINYGIDRERMLRFLRNGIGKPGHGGIIPYGMPGHDSTHSHGYSYQPEKARALLAETGLTAPQITITTTADYVDLIKYIQAQLGEIGFDVRIDVSPAAAMREMRARGKLPVFRASWVADYPDAENYLSLFYSPNFTPVGPNYTHYHHEQFDALYEKALVESDSEKRFAYYRQMDSLMMQDAPVVVLFYDEVLRFVNKRVGGLGSNPVNLLDLRRVKINEQENGGILQ